VDFPKMFSEGMKINRMEGSGSLALLFNVASFKHDAAKMQSEHKVCRCKSQTPPP